MSEVNQRKRSPSPPLSSKPRSLSPEQEERKKNAAIGMRRKNKKGSDFFDKYSYHLVIGGFLALCVIAFGSTLFKSSGKLNTVPVIDEEEISSHNSQGYSHQLGQNEFFANWMLSDAKYIMNNHLTFKSQVTTCASKSDSTIIPQSYNFRQQYTHCAHPIYNQGNCSSSYAVAATSAISDRICKNRGETFKGQLSPQTPISCDKQKNFGCNGGSVSRVFDYAIKNGLVLNECMKFESGTDDSKDCATALVDCEKFKVVDYCVTTEEEAIKREILKNGPTVAVIPIYRDFLIYKSGVYQVIEGTSRFQQGHAIKIIGWGSSENGVSYWIIENSWGQEWGMNGLGYIATGQIDLLIEKFVIAPIVEETTAEEPKVEIQQQAEPVIRNVVE